MPLYAIIVLVKNNKKGGKIMDLNKRIDRFAQLAIKTGINVQNGETLLIRADVESRDFARRCVKEAYKAGAKHVYLEYSDELVTRETYLSAPEDSFDEYPEWQSYKYTQIAKEGGSFLSILSSDPDLMKGVDSSRIGRFQKIAGKYLKEWRSYTLTDKVKWSIIATPSAAWASRVHPELSKEDAIEKLWIEILDCSRVTDNPVDEWKKHVSNLSKKTDWLNKMNFKKLHYKSSKTDLVIELPENHIWQSGSARDPQNIEFCPNIPTEEVYSMPHKYGVNGVVYSTKPLIYAGSLIDDFWIKFKDGKIVDFDAKSGKENLNDLINTDDGSSRLGEVALVPYDSPISNTDTVFYNTLFDENASCHLAIGAAYSSNIKNGENMNEDEMDKAGMNSSLTHVDFMIGDKDLNIVGVTNKEESFQIFKDGNWSF